MKRRNPSYSVVVIGLPPADIKERVSQLHAKAIKARSTQVHLVSDAPKAVSESRRPAEELGL